MDSRNIISDFNFSYFKIKIVKERIVILGSGESGVGAALLAKSKGFDVFVTDKNSIPNSYRKELIEAKIEFEEGQHSMDSILSASTVVKSPGIPSTSDVVLQIKRSGIPIISEIEFAYKYVSPSTRFIAITGSNGKTTTTLLTYHIAQTLGWNVGLAGNIGTSLARQIVDTAHDVYIVELSSFQLDDMYAFHPSVAVLLNITPDHLDRYEYQFEKYIQSKFRITQQLTEKDTFIYYAEDAAIQSVLSAYLIPAKKWSIALQANSNAAAYSTKDQFNFPIISTSSVWDSKLLPIQGKHNQLNAMAAILAVHALGASIEESFSAAQSFKNAPHRLEKVGVLNGALYVNDSKATNVDSVWYALDATPAPIVWIAGGVDKGNDYSTLRPFIEGKVKTLISLNKDHSKLLAGVGPYISSIIEVNSMEEAIEKAMTLTEEGDTVLLSPACASFDLFKNYEDRGNQFRSIVQRHIRPL